MGVSPSAGQEVGEVAYRSRPQAVFDLLGAISTAARSEGLEVSVAGQSASAVLQPVRRDAESLRVLLKPGHRLSGARPETVIRCRAGMGHQQASLLTVVLQARGSVLDLKFPQNVAVRERRASRRFRTPELPPVELITSDGRVRARAVDLSVDGVALLVNADTAASVAGDVLRGELRLGRAGRLQTWLEMRYTRPTTQRGQFQLEARFIGLSSTGVARVKAAIADWEPLVG